MATGTISNKGAFLDNVSAKLGRDRTGPVILPDWRHQPQLEVYKGASADELAEAFAVSSAEKSTYVAGTDSAYLLRTVQEIIAKYGGGSVVVPQDERFREFGLEEMLAGPETHIWDPELGDENIEIAKRANIGLFFSDAALAESGTVVQFNNRHIPRSISLLPTVYIAIVPKSTIVPRMTQVNQEIHRSVERGETLSTCINFISGPSNSADIEMNIVIGVHGPVEAVHIVVGDR